MADGLAAVAAVAVAAVEDAAVEDVAVEDAVDVEVDSDALAQLH